MPIPTESWPQRLLRWVAGFEDALLAGLLLVMICLGALQIFLRNGFDSGIAWVDPLLRVLVLWVGLLGAMAATRDDKHIRIDVLTRYLPLRWREWSMVVTDLFTAGICALVAWHAYRFVGFEREDGMLAFASIPSWWLETIIPIGFGLIAVRMLINAADHSLKALKGQA